MTRLRWLELSAMSGVVVSRETTLFRRYWRSTTFSSVVEPTIYLLAFGFGFGSLVAVVARLPLHRVPRHRRGGDRGAVLARVRRMFVTFIRRVYQKSYDAVLATPVDVHELVAAEATWIATKSGVYGCVPLLVAIAFGLDPSWGMLLVPLIGFLTGLGFALFGIWTSRQSCRRSTRSTTSSPAVLTPLFLVAGTFFPIEGLPDWARALAQLNPLYHCVELVRTPRSACSRSPTSTTRLRSWCSPR